MFVFWHLISITVFCSFEKIGHISAVCSISKCRSQSWDFHVKDFRETYRVLQVVLVVGHLTHCEGFVISITDVEQRRLEVTDAPSVACTRCPCGVSHSLCGLL